MYALEECLKQQGRTLADISVSIQGFGNVGSHAARLIDAQGGKIVAVSDISGGIINDQGIDVNVCGNYAASFGVGEDDFVDYVDVAARGPAKINAYKKDGYVVLFINEPEKSI